MLLLADQWKDFELLDTGDAEKIERWGKFILRRPDPQAVWEKQNPTIWNQNHGHYIRSHTGGGQWNKQQFPDEWIISYKHLRFNIRPTGFKHTGLFPEQAVNWDFMMNKIKGANRKIKVLNLFAYTGGASVACASAGAEVCHVDASKGVVAWAKDNMRASGLQDAPVRYIVEDVIKFVQREIRRGNTYDGIIMDPPVYGRGSNGELWKLEEKLMELVKLTQQVLSDEPIFFIINSYTSSFSSTTLHNILESTIQTQYKGKITSGEIGLKGQAKLVLPCGIFGRWES